MFLELNVSLKIEITDELNEELAGGEPEAFLKLEKTLIDAMTQGGLKVTHVEIQDAGPHNTVFNEDRPSKFTGKFAGKVECTSPCIDNYCPIHGINATKEGK